MGCMQETAAASVSTPLTGEVEYAERPQTPAVSGTEGREPGTGKWLPGYAPNPNGRPKKGNTFGEKMRAQLDKISGPGSDATNADALVKHALQQALSGEPQAVRWFEALMDRTEGKVAIPVEVSQVALIVSQADYDAIP